MPGLFVLISGKHNMELHEISASKSNMIILNADRIDGMTDDEIIKIVRHALNHYRVDEYMKFQRESLARARVLVLSGDLIPVDETGQKTSGELYMEILEEDKREQEQNKR